MHLTKHHGLGNDFLVHGSADRAGGAPAPDAALARALCDRHRGIGADGLLVLRLAGEGDRAVDVTMVLLNADGSGAEMSGNGIGCLAQAAVLGGLAAGPTLSVRTEAGLRWVELAPTEDPRTHQARVAMGAVSLADADDPAWAVEGVSRATWAGVGNPHLVLLVDDQARLADRAWLSDIGAKANARTPGGVNVEAVTPAATGTSLRMDVYERGVGLTDACGTGAVASAAAARRWGLAGDRVTVEMVGGPVEVRLEGDDAELTTPITHIADIEIPWL